IEDFLCIFYAGTISLNGELFEKLSNLILEHREFEENPEYQYLYFISRSAFFRFNGELHFAIEACEKANKLSYIVNNPYYIIKSLMYFSILYDSLNEYEMALSYIERAMKLLEEVDDPAIAGDVYNSFGLILQDTGEFQRAKEVYCKALEFYNNISGRRSHLNYCILILNTGEVSALLNQMEEAEKYFDLGISIAEEQECSDFLERHIISIAEIFYKKKLYEKAYQYIKKYISLQDRIKIIQQKISKIYDHERFKEELSTLYFLHNQNESLNNRLTSLYNRIEATEKKQEGKGALFSEINQALIHKEFHSYFQPKWSLREKKFTGAEALARWIKEDGTIIYPDDFIGLIEDTNLINMMSEQIIQQAFRFCKEVCGSINPHFIISINIAPYQLEHQNVVRLIEKEMFLNGLFPENIEIEITERTFFDNNIKIMNQLYELKELGVKIALDDFGTGYSSLACLNRIPFETVKIDRDFLINASSVEHGEKMLSGIINLLHDMNFLVVAEGVSKKEHVELLEKLGSDELQGFYYSKAITGDQLIQLLQS
ncbi:MAG: EAL domain-containing protein, partial [Spirochaetaceae bacterium]|nr:EAL domain-containing protein [Spirochaetaceae bacterium]